MPRQTMPGLVFIKLTLEVQQQVKIDRRISPLLAQSREECRVLVMDRRTKVKTKGG